MTDKSIDKKVPNAGSRYIGCFSFNINKLFSDKIFYFAFITNLNIPNLNMSIKITHYNVRTFVCVEVYGPVNPTESCRA